MALSIVSITRDKPLPCQHFTFVINDDGIEHTTRGVTVEDLQNTSEWTPRAPLRWLLAFSYIRYRFNHGATLAQLVGVTIAT